MKSKKVEMKTYKVFIDQFNPHVYTVMAKNKEEAERTAIEAYEVSYEVVDVIEVKDKK